MNTELFQLVVGVSRRDSEAIGGLLMELGAGAVEERARGRGAELVVYAESRHELAVLAVRARPLLAGFGLARDALRLERAPRFDWVAAGVAQARPAQLTRRLRIAPLDLVAASDRTRTIAIRPGLAFGDGAHATTRLAARAVERLCRRRPGLRVLDVGTGNGVLAFVAAKSGASEVVGIEPEPGARALARTNARANELACPVSFRARWPRGEPVFELVVANLEPRILLAEASRIAHAARRAEQLVVTGFLTTQGPLVTERFEGEGFSLLGRAREKGWLLLTLERLTGRRRTGR